MELIGDVSPTAWAWGFGAQGQDIHENARRKVDLARKKCQIELKKLREEQDRVPERFSR